MGTTERLSKWVVDFDRAMLSPEGIENIKNSILDTLGVALVGSVQPTGVKIRDLVKEFGGNPQARIIGSGNKTSVLNATLVNGTFAHVEDYDDIGGFGHCGAALTPPIMALGEHLKLSGEKALESYAVGFEIGNRLRATTGEVQFEGGFHSTSLFGTIVSAIESAKLLGLNVEQTRATFGIAASMASGVMQNAGMDAKALHAGHATRCGILAANLAKKGFTGDPDILEGKRGFFYVYGEEQADIKRVNENLNKIFAITDADLIIKAWPCCYGNHPAITAIFRLLQNNDIKPQEVEAIDVVGTGKPSRSPLIRHHPQRGFEGKFSMEYNMSTALVDRKIDLYSYTDEKLTRPIIQELMKKVKVNQAPEFVDRPWRLYGEGSYIMVVLKLKDGRLLSQKETKGRHLKGEEVYTKYRENAEFGGISKSKIEHSIKLVKGLEHLEDITELMDALVIK